MYCYNYAWGSRFANGVQFVEVKLPINSPERFEELRQNAKELIKEQLGCDMTVFGPLVFLHINDK